MLPSKSQPKSQQSITDLVGSLYDCIPDDTRWAGVLDDVRVLCDGYLATLAVVDTHSNTPRFSVACGNKQALEPLLTHYAQGMPFYAAVPKMELDVPLTIDSIYELQGPDTRDTWLNSKMATEWAIPNNIDDCFWVPVMKQPDRVGNLVVITHRDRPQITKPEIAMVASLAPHIRRAVSIGDLFEMERRKGEIFRDVVDALSHPVLIVSADMHIIFANLAAENLLREKIIASSIRGELSLTYGHAHRAISQAVATGTKDEFALGAMGINVPMANAPTPSVAHVLPLAQRDPSQRVSQRAAAAIFIASAGNTPSPAMDAIAALFGLTAAEKRVACQISLGKSRQEIALASGLSDGTIKTQLSAIFDKTNTEDQRDLALLIRDLTPQTCA
jgi:DNA-binding CsgD family transcriptional regulator/PAS domain-containing protein